MSRVCRNEHRIKERPSCQGIRGTVLTEKQVTEKFEHV